jgi:DNA-binding GntR family transcriptional regulator
MPRLIVRTLSERLVDVVRFRILNGDAKSDQPIRQDALASELGVSKIPLREALARLEEEGLVRSHPNRGYFVRALVATEADEVFKLRLKLEPEAAAQAAHCATSADRETAVAAFKALDPTDRSGKATIIALNRTFHLALVRPSGLPITMQLLERLHVLSDRYVGKYLETMGQGERATDEHGLLLERWLARDCDSIITVLHAHIENTLTEIQCRLAEETAVPISVQA